MTLKLLAVGDLHLGRRPTRLPADLAARADDYSPAEAWRRSVDLAIHEGAEAVLLAGDVVESRHDYFEALPRLQTGVAALSRAGIQTFAVSGNHDVNILPPLIDRVPDAHLLGRNGRWESVQLGDPGHGDSATLWGWSFPAERVRHNPLTQLPDDRRTGLRLGLLHCDRDQADSPYAPVTGETLRDARFDAWLLGHIHQPDGLDVDNASGYLGTVVGLDAGEPGARGPWLIEVADGHIQRFEQRPLAPLRWERIDIDIGGAAGEADVVQRLDARLEALARALDRADDRPDLIGLRLRFTGDCDLVETDITPAVPQTDHSMELPGLDGTIRWFVESWRIDTRPVTPLSRLAERDDQPGLLARRLLVLERDATDADRAALLEAADRHLQSMPGHAGWSQLPGPWPDRQRLADWLRESGQNALRAMLAQERD
ncbi:metallophosphoesterase family protein [Spiribacter roseus]|uniref:metallophosphoesterase family protein n=1 Tax=Spiribacter roseus TaxID=1855875 RepID=UPI0013302480|nr:metallophosphoesterase [Spiribacter roseus]KAF0284204.1 hypothetical protein BA898_07580 [Spiribacter roseus]